MQYLPNEMISLVAQQLPHPRQTEYKGENNNSINNKERKDSPIHMDQWMVVAFSSRADDLGECSTIRSPPALFFFFFSED